MGLRPITPGLVEADIASVISNKALHPNAIQYSIIVHTPTMDIDVIDLVSIETNRDYANNITDYILVTFTIALGTYIKQIRSIQDNLEMSIITDHYGKKYHSRYKMILNGVPDAIAGSIYTSYTETELNKMDVVVIEAQCLSRLVESIRLTPVSGVYNYVTVSDVIKTVISHTIDAVKIEGSAISYNINIITPNNSKTYRHIIIPTGIRVIDLPSFLQNTDYGVYSSDIGTYIQKIGYFEKGVTPKETIFVYPLYNNKITNTPGKQLMVLSSPNTLVSRSENSYLIDGDVIKIIGSGDMHGSEISQTKLMQNGSSVVISNPDHVIIKGTNGTDDTVSTSSKTNLTGSNLKIMKDGGAPTKYIGPTANKYKQYSAIARDMLSMYHVTWNFSNPELLYPGMPVMYIYEDDVRGVVRLTGVLHSTFTKYSGPYKTNTTFINMLLEPYVDGTSNSNSTVDVSYK